MIYFKYDSLVQHPQVVIDGVLPMKVKLEIVLKDWVEAIVIPAELRDAFEFMSSDYNYAVETIVIPTELRDEIEATIPKDLSEKVMYVENDCKDIWEWSEKVYCIIEKM